MRFWYLRRAVPWAAIAGCLAAAVVLALMVRQWPEISLFGLPLLVGTCAAASGFAFDEPATAVASVSPRAGWWRGSTRYLGAVVPLAVCLVLLVAMPGELGLDLTSWFLISIGLVLSAVASAAWAARRQISRPGGAIAGAMVLLCLTPLVLSLLLGWESIYPVGPFPEWVRTLWMGVIAAGATVCLTGLPATPVARFRRRTAPTRRPTPH